MEIELNHPETFVEPEPEASLRLFSLSVDFASSARAKWASGIIAQLVGPRWKVSSKTGMLDSWHDGHLAGKTMLQDAAGADVLIIANSPLAAHESKLIEWLKALADRKPKRRDSGLFICLFGNEDYEAGMLDRMVKRLMRCAQKMGRDFIWHRLRREGMNDAGWLADNLEKFLARRQSRSNLAWLQEPASVGQLPEAVWLVADMG